MKCDPQNWAELYPDVHALDVQWPWASLATSDAEPSKQDGTNFRLPSSSGWITLDPAVGARIAWIRDGRGAWKELRAGTWMRSHGNNLRVAGSLFAPEYHARVLHSERPFTIIDCGRAESAGPVQIVTVDMLSQIAAGIGQGKPSAAGAAVSVSSDLMRWSVLDGRAGVGRAWVRVGGANSEYAPVEHGAPFPIDGAAGFEVRVHPSEYGSKATFVHSCQPQRIGPAPIAEFEATLTASTATLSNCLVWPGFDKVNAANGKVAIKSTGIGTYSLDYHTDAGSGAAPTSGTLSTAATDTTNQIIATPQLGAQIISVRLVTFGGHARAWVARI